MDPVIAETPVSGRLEPPFNRPPSRVRWGMLALLFLISVITYVDRVNISVAAQQMTPALGLTQVQMGYVFSAFVLGYALCQLPGGWLGDRLGAHKVLTAAVLWWSLFTALTAAVGGVISWPWGGVAGALLVVRFLVGVGEAAALPNFNRTVAEWLASGERGAGMGISLAGIGVGGAITPPICAWLMVNFGWQSAFYVSGAAGILIALAWAWYATDRPEQHRHVNDAELRHIRGQDLLTPPAPRAGDEPVPWRGFLYTPTVWWLVLSYTGLGYIAYIYLSWFYLYLVNARGFSVLQGAAYASGPFVTMALCCPLGGWLSDRLAGALGLNQGRAWVGASGMLLAAVSIIAGSYLQDAYAAILLLSLGAGFLYFTVGAFWASTIDRAPHHAGTLSGIMNTGANLGGTLSPTLTPWLAQHYGWNTSFGVAAAIAVLAGLLWFAIRPGDGLRTDR
jgi:ACS family glucarate transporter-like MFS transporter